MDPSTSLPASKAVAVVPPMIASSQSSKVHPPREYNQIDSILDWHIEAKDDDGGDIREFNRLMALYDGTLVEREARDYRRAFLDAWLTDRLFKKISDEQREKCLETFRQLQKAIIKGWRICEWDHHNEDVSALTQAAYYIYSELLDSTLGSEDTRYGLYEIYESSTHSGPCVKVFDDGSLIIQDRNDQMTLCMNVSCGLERLVENLEQEQQQAA
jgi:hypothetical protein